MSVLSLLNIFRSPSRKPELKPAEKAFNEWNKTGNPESFFRYMALEDALDGHDLGVEMFFFHVQPAARYVGENGFKIATVFQEAASRISDLEERESGSIDRGFMANVERWQTTSAGLEKAGDPISFALELDLVVERMTTIASLFGQFLSRTAVESGINFAGSLLQSLPQNVYSRMGEINKMKIWLRALHLLTRCKEVLGEEAPTEKDLEVIFRNMPRELADQARRLLFPR